MRDPQEVLRGVSRKEIWRYLGYSRIRPDSRVDGVIDSCLEEKNCCRLRSPGPSGEILPCVPGKTEVLPWYGRNWTAWDRNRSWWRWRSAAGACPATWKDAAGYI